MTMSSRLRDRWGGGEDPVVTQECPQHVHPAAGERDHGLDVFESLAAFFEVEVAVGAFTDDAALRRQVEHAAEAAAVTLGAVQGPRAAARGAWAPDQPRPPGAGARVGVCGPGTRRAAHR